MTQSDEHKAKLAAARAEAARKRSEALEKEAADLVESVSEFLTTDDRNMFEYIRKQIASGRREPGDVAILREARQTHLNTYLRRTRNA